MRRLFASAPASAAVASGAAIVLSGALAAPASAGLVSVVGSQASAQLSDSIGVLKQDSFLVSSLLTEFYFAEGFGNGAYGAFAMDVRAASIKFTFDYQGGSSLFFAPGVTMQVTFAPSFSIDSFTVGTVDAGISGIENADLGRVANVVTIDLSGITIGNPGDSFVLNFAASAVPGPASLAGLALLAVGGRRRR